MVAEIMHPVFVMQESTGLPVYYHIVPGNSTGIPSIKDIFHHHEYIGIGISSCIIDDGFSSEDDLDLFYDENHRCIIDFIARIGTNDKNFTETACKVLASLESRENLVNYDDQSFFISKSKVYAGPHKDQPAWMYIVLVSRYMSDVQRELFKKIQNNSLSMDEVRSILQKDLIFGILSGKEYSCEEILPAYLRKQSADYMLAYTTDYARIFPISIGGEAICRGHLLLSYIAYCAGKMMQLKRKRFFSEGALAYLGGQKSEVFPDRIDVFNPPKKAASVYRAFGIQYPDEIKIRNGALDYTPGASVSVRKKQNKKSSERGHQKSSDNKSGS